MFPSPAVSVLYSFSHEIVLLQLEDNDQIINISNVYLFLVSALYTHTLRSWTFFGRCVITVSFPVLFVLQARDNESHARARGCRRSQSNRQPVNTTLSHNGLCRCKVSVVQ